MWIISLGKGFCLGFAAYIMGFSMDVSISQSSFLSMMKEISTQSIHAYYTIQMNLLVISPLVYMVNDKYLIDHKTSSINYRHGVMLLLIHHIGYYIVHRSMHQIEMLRKYHDYHHEFVKHLCPSIGNAVSHSEFLFAYILPFIIGAYLIRPNEITFILPIGFISLFNNIIHCKELRYLPWLPFFVSPNMHIKHHEIRNKHFSAPILILDYLIENNEERD